MSGTGKYFTSIYQIKPIKKKLINVHSIYQNIPLRYVAIVLKSYYNNRGGIHYFSENLSSQTGATYQGLYKKSEFR